jgi:hypothetical protein
VARNLYHAFGFTETGDMDGEERIAVLELPNYRNRDATEGRSGA